MYKLLLIGGVIAVIVVGWLALAHRGGSGEEYKDDHLSFSYPEDYKPQSKLTPETHSKNLLRLAVAKPLSTIELDKETGAIIGANVTKTPFLDYLTANAERNFARVYPSYQKGDSQRLQLAGQAVQHINFSYTGKDKTTKLYMHAYIITSGNDAYYLYVQSTDQKRAEADAKMIQSSLKLF